MAKKTYTVKEGDNLAALSRKLGIPIEAIQSYNGIHNLTPGQTIKIPRSGVGEVSNPDQGFKNSYTAAQGVYSTGADERRTLNVNGSDVRMGPNSTIDTRIKPEGNQFQNFVNTLSGNAPVDQYNRQSTAAGGSLAGIPQQGVPTEQQMYQLGNLPSYGGNDWQPGTNAGVSQFSYAPRGSGYQSTAAPSANLGLMAPAPLPGWQNGVNAGRDQFSYAPSGYNSQASPQSNMGLDPSYAAMYQPQPIGASGRMGGVSPSAPFWNQGQTNQFSYSPQGQQNSYSPYGPIAPKQFSYSPQGQPNSFQPYQPHPQQQQAAPFLTSSMMAHPSYGNPVIGGGGQPSRYGNYAVGNKLYSGQAKTAQENFQQTGGLPDTGNRWWIRKGQGGDPNAQARANAAANARVMSQGQNVLKTNWRV